VTPSLTLEQVKKAGRPAQQHLFHYEGASNMWAFMGDYWVVHLDGKYWACEGPELVQLFFSAEDATIDRLAWRPLDCGWHHNEGCDCEFCREAA